MTKRAKGTLALILAFVVLANAGIFWKLSYSKTHTSGDTIVVRVGDTVAANHPISQALYIFEEELERISNGRFDVRVYINSALGGDRQQTESVILGYMQGNTPPTSVLAGFDTRFMVVDLPFVFKSGEAAMKTLNGDLGEELDPILEDLGLHAVGWTESGYRPHHDEQHRGDLARGAEGSVHPHAGKPYPHGVLPGLGRKPHADGVLGALHRAAAGRGRRGGEPAGRHHGQPAL